MATLETRVGEIQERRRAAVVAANDRLRQIAGQLGIRAKLETQTPTVGGRRVHPTRDRWQEIDRKADGQ